MNIPDEIRRLTGSLAPGAPPSVQPTERSVPSERPGAAGRPSFSDVMGDLVKDVDKLQKAAESASEKLVTGELQDVHQVVVAMEEAQTSFRLLMEVRNKMIDAYREVMKMQT